jgi:hypothetical protein
MNIETILTALTFVEGIALLIIFLTLYCKFFIISNYDFKEEKNESKSWEDPLVSCEECKCLLNKFYSHEVKVNSVNAFYDEDINHYCQKCKPNYKSILQTQDKIYYFKELEVTEQGEPVGYKKDK